MEAKVKLYKPKDYDITPKEQLEKICNGCGPAGWKAKFNSILGCNVSECCQIHDFQYEFGESLEDKRSADRVFLNNLLRVINSKDSWKITTYFRRKIAYGYYKAVDRYGGPAYWADKN